MLRYRTGVANSRAAGIAMAAYLTTERLQPENTDRARYYAGEVVPEPRSLVEQFGLRVAAGEMLYSEALDELMRHQISHGVEDLAAAEERLGDQLAVAAERAEAQAAVAGRGGTVAKVRRDLHPTLAARLGIDQGRPITVGEIGNLLNGLRTDGAAIEGKQVQKPMRSVAEVFGLDGRRMPTAAEVDHVLAGRTAAGVVPVNAKGAELPAEVVKGARGRFLAAFGATAGQEPTADEIEHIKAGRLMSGFVPAEGDNVLGKLTATKAPVAYIDLVWSADKSVTLAWALAPTQAEAAMVLEAHRAAVDSAMAYVEQRLGFTRKGQAGRDGVEKGNVAWIKFDHYTSRPTAEIARKDAEGRAYTEFTDVPMLVADPQLHTHSTMLNAVMTESGRIGALDLDQIDGLVKEFGAVYQAFVAKNLRLHGIEVALDRETGAARVTAIPLSVRRHFSKRSQEGHEAAREYAAKQGLDWDKLAPDLQTAILQRGHEETRKPKAKGTEGESDQTAWKAQAEAIGYHHRSVLRHEIAPELGTDERRQLGYDVSLGLLEASLSRRAKLNGQELREYAARGLIEAGIDDPSQDIGAITKAYRERGVRQEGEQVALLWGKDAPVRGKERWSVTTALHETAERELTGLAERLGADRSAALPMAAIDRAARDYLASHPFIDPASEQWARQREVIDRLGTGGRLGVAIGVAGAGKSTMLSPLVDALQKEGNRTVYGVAVAWRQAGALADAGIAKQRLVAMDAFIRRVEAGRYAPGPDTVVVIDELGQIGRRHMLDLLRLQQSHGFQVLAVGDPKQCQSIEAGPVIDLLRQALGPEAVPEILTTIRQRAERERQIAGLFREGKAGTALALKREDGTAILVAGGKAPTVERVAELWRQRTEARGDDPDFRLTVSAPTNADANALGAAIRLTLRDMGRLGEDVIELPTVVRDEVADLRLAVGDRVRVFDRVHASRREVLASNGDVVEVLEVSEAGMVAKNAAGRSAFVPWDKLREKDGPVRLAYGYALTIDASQGINSSEHIDALPSGSQVVHAFKAYVAESRHREATYIVVNEAAERREVRSRVPLGDWREIGEADVWSNIAANLSRQPQKASATDFIRNSTGLRRGTIYSVQHGCEPGDRREQRGERRAAVHRRAARMEMEKATVTRRLAQHLLHMERRAVESLTLRQSQRRGQRLRM